MIITSKGCKILTYALCALVFGLASDKNWKEIVKRIFYVTVACYIIDEMID